MSRLGRLVLTSLVLLSGVSCSFTESLPESESEPAAVVVPIAPQWEVNEAAFEKLGPGGGSIQISLASQRLSLINPQGQRVLETDCSTGKAGKRTPTGRFRVLEKLEDKRSNKYGSYVSTTTGEVVAPRSWLVKRPPGSRYVGTPLPCRLRLTWAGVGIHVGQFEPGTRTSMGCIRVPEEAQRRLFEKATVGTLVQIH